VSQELDIYLRGGSVGAVRERPREEYSGHQFADYALKLTGKPAAVVEAKKTSRDARNIGPAGSWQLAIVP
jgi:type I site-specific restriction endonuclease